MALPDGAGPPPGGLIELGVVGRAHGLRGECHVQAWHPESPLWRPGTVFQVLAPGALAPARPLRALRARRVPDGDVVVAFEGLHSREDAEALRGHVLAVPAETLPAPEADEVYHHEVVGWLAVDPTGAPLGVVTGVLSLPAQDVLALETIAGRRALVPFVGAIVTAIDRPARRLVLDPPEGLLDGDDEDEPPPGAGARPGRHGAAAGPVSRPAPEPRGPRRPRSPRP